jgi:hypothetical protein
MEINFKRVFQTLTQVLDGTLVLSPEDKAERLKEVAQAAQGFANPKSDSFGMAFLKTCQDQVTRIRLSKFNAMKAHVDMLINEGLDATSAWLDVYAQYYPYKSVQFMNKCEDNCNELEELFDFACYPDVAFIAKSLYC